MNFFELVTKLSALQAESIDQAAKAAVQSGVTGAKEAYMGWGKSVGLTNKALEDEWKVAQPEKAKGGRGGFAEHFYDWLAEDSRTEVEAHDYIMADESENTRRHLTHFLNIWALAQTVRTGSKVSRTISAGKASPKPKGERREGASSAKAQEQKDTWEYNSASPYEDVRSAWETLKRELAAKRPRKTAVHPDKVAKFNDAKLTEAYTKAFQTFNTKR